MLVHWKLFKAFNVYQIKHLPWFLTHGTVSPNKKLEIENPSSDWLNSVKKAKKDLNHIDIVRRHLISATAKDFSLIIAFTDLSDCKMQLVDLDCKPTSKLFEHVQ